MFWAPDNNVLGSSLRYEGLNIKEKLIFACYVNYLLCEQIGGEFCQAKTCFSQRNFLFYLDRQFGAEAVEILQREKMYVRRIVPAKRQLPGNGGFAKKEQLRSGPPVSKVGKTDNHFFADTQQFCKNLFWIFQRLHSL